MYVSICTKTVHTKNGILHYDISPKHNVYTKLYTQAASIYTPRQDAPRQCEQIKMTKYKQNEHKLTHSGFRRRNLSGRSQALRGRRGRGPTAPAPAHRSLSAGNERTKRCQRAQRYQLVRFVVILLWLGVLTSVGTERATRVRGGKGEGGG